MLDGTIADRFLRHLHLFPQREQRNSAAADTRLRHTDWHALVVIVVCLRMVHSFQQGDTVLSLTLLRGNIPLAGVHFRALFAPVTVLLHGAKSWQLARRSTLERFFRQHHVHGEQRLNERLEAIKSATALTSDEGIIRPQALLVKALVTQLRATLEAIGSFDQAIAERAQHHPDFALFEALPGAGAALAPRLLVAFGEQRERYGSAAEVQTYAGIAPVMERSGKQSWVHWRCQCPKFMRQTFVEWAAESMQFSFWARAYYQQQRDKGASHQAAVRSLAFKWIRIVFRCWQTGTPYNESTYLAALQRQGSPLISNLAKSSKSGENM